MVLALIKGGADINNIDNEGNTPLHIASYWNNEKIVKLLVDNGASLNVKNNLREIPADRTDNKKIREFLLK